MTRTFLGLLLLLLLLGPSSALPAQQGTPASGGRGRFTVTGTVRDTDTNEAVNNTLVELHQFSGPTISSVFTSEDGSFTFSNLSSGTYDLVVDRTGFDHADQQVSLYNNVNGLEVDLRRSGSNHYVPPGGPVVSARELSIPRKAHDSMQKGLDLLYQKSDYKGSLVQFQRAIKEYPDYYEAFAQIGVADAKLGDAADAELALRKSLAMSKDRYVDGCYLLATLLNNAQRFGEAEPFARKGADLNGNSWQSHFQLARALFGENNLADAETSAETAKQLAPDNPETFLVLANIHSRTRDYASLLDDLNAYLKLDPKGPAADQARDTRAKILQSLDDTSSGDSTADKAASAK